MISRFFRMKGEYISTQDKLTTTERPPEQTSEPCRGDSCRSNPNVVGLVIGSILGTLAIIIIIILITWLFLRQKYKNQSKNQITTTVKFIEQPSLYTDGVNANDNESKSNGMSPSNNDSISSHYYEKIHYDHDQHS